MGTKPLPSTAPVGSTFNLNITITDVIDLYGWEFNMTFNATVLNVIDVIEGPFLLDFAYSVGVGTWLVGPTIDNTNGWVLMGDSLFPFPDPPDGADGSGVLATIVFSVQMKGKSDLHFASTKLNSWDSVSGLLVAIPHTAKDGFFQEPLGDVDGDGDVDTSDLSVMSNAYGSRNSIPNWNPNCDFNKDNKVDISDLFNIGKNYGKS